MTDRNRALEGNPLERWPGYHEQSWQERFVQLDALLSAEREARDKIVQKMTDEIYRDRAPSSERQAALEEAVRVADDEQKNWPEDTQAYLACQTIGDALRSLITPATIGNGGALETESGEMVVERVARAMCDGDWDAKDFCETADGQEPEEQREYWREKARAAIAAMQSGGITDAMWEAAWSASEDYFVGDAVSQKGLRLALQAMLAALTQEGRTDG